MSVAGGDPPTARASYACPSAPATPGAGLLGVLGPDGKIHNLRTPITVDADFLNAAKAAGPPEARMRFTGTCQTSGCSQWTGSRCGVIDRALQALQAPVQPELPPCTIRATCRWFAQTGPKACATCALIVTDTRIAAE
ncbi:MAG: hypothetical protein V4586_19965 [Pseudomonadota bacterium]